MPHRTSSVRRIVVAGMLLLVLGLEPIGEAAHASPAPGVNVEQRARPDIVLILMDDFSIELLRTMRHARAMKERGAVFRNAFVVDSLCCPSRAAILTGRPPHQTGVLVNRAVRRRHPIGGYKAFVTYGNVPRSFNFSLRQSGYATGLVGKFMNGYEARVVDGQLRPPPRVRGWSSWMAVLGGGYNGWHFSSTRLNAQMEVLLRHHAKPARSDPSIDRSYVTNVIARKALRFIKVRDRRPKPYFLEIAVYGPHSRLDKAYADDPFFPPAMADRPRATRPGGNCGTTRCSNLTLADLTGYDDPRRDNRPVYLHEDGSTSVAPAWRTNPRTLSREDALMHYRNRARMVQAVDRLIGRVLRTAGDNTYVILTSDNGFHLGQHRLNIGKGTPYDSDTRVPLIVLGPDVAPGPRRQFVSNIDLAPTIEELAGLSPAGIRSGLSFASALARPEVPGSDYVFMEHTYLAWKRGSTDPDIRRRDTSKEVPSYVAVRGRHGLLARIDLDHSWTGTDYAWELYRYDRPWEDTNVFASDHQQPWAVDLMRHLETWLDCDPSACRAARS